MNENYRNILNKISALEAELAEELRKQEEKLGYQIEDGKVVFQQKITEAQQKLKTNVLPWLLNSKTKNLLSVPFIYPLLIPFLFLDICVTLYQFVCFSLYGIKKVKRKEYILFDHHHLKYLNAIEKLNCLYCSYANGVIAYVREIASRTEQYWCPIKHGHKVRQPHDRYANFVDYGETGNFHGELQKLRESLKKEGNQKQP